MFMLLYMLHIFAGWGCSRLNFTNIHSDGVRYTSVGQIKEKAGLENLETVQTAVCVYFLWNVVTEFKGEIDTVVRSVFVLTTFAQVPTETGTC